MRFCTLLLVMSHVYSLNIYVLYTCRLKDKVQYNFLSSFLQRLYALIVNKDKNIFLKKCSKCAPQAEKAVWGLKKTSEPNCHVIAVT